jgi:hypothetical protein
MGKVAHFPQPNSKVRFRGLTWRVCNVTGRKIKLIRRHQHGTTTANLTHEQFAAGARGPNTSSEAGLLACVTPKASERTVSNTQARPTIVCLCGSTRFWREFQKAGLEETLAGKIVLSIGAATGSDEEHFGHLPVEEFKVIKDRLDALHLEKIKLADELRIINPGGYIGESTFHEVLFALSLNKPIRWDHWPTRLNARPQYVAQLYARYFPELLPQATTPSAYLTPAPRSGHRYPTPKDGSGRRYPTPAPQIGHRGEADA